MENNPDPPEDFREFSDEEIKDILREALTLQIKDKRKIPKKNELNNALIGTIGEFLSCFKLIGYDLEGNPINMTVYKEKMEKSALDNAFMEEIGRFMNGRMG
jgi:hypothetical protein